MRVTPISCDAADEQCRPAGARHGDEVERPDQEEPAADEEHVERPRERLAGSVETILALADDVVQLGDRLSVEAAVARRLGLEPLQQVRDPSEVSLGARRLDSVPHRLPLATPDRRDVGEDCGLELLAEWVGNASTSV